MLLWKWGPDVGHVLVLVPTSGPLESWTSPPPRLRLPCPDRVCVDKMYFIHPAWEHTNYYLDRWYVLWYWMRDRSCEAAFPYIFILLSSLNAIKPKSKKHVDVNGPFTRKHTKDGGGGGTGGGGGATCYMLSSSESSSSSRESCRGRGRTGWNHVTQLACTTSKTLQPCWNRLYPHATRQQNPQRHWETHKP